MSKSVFIQELVREDGRWRMAIGEVTSAEDLSHEMFPPGSYPPPGFTIEEEIIQYEPEKIGNFFIAGVTEAAVTAMEQGFAEAFRNAGFRDGPADGMVRTWFKDIAEPWDMPEEEAAQLYCDAFVDVRLPNLSEMTIWDPIQDQLCEFRYANDKTFSTRLGSIEQSQMSYDFLWNDSNYLIVPVNQAWEPVLSARTTPNMFQFRYLLEMEDTKIRGQQLEIGEMVLTFAKAIQRLATESQFKNPVDSFREGLRT